MLALSHELRTPLNAVLGWTHIRRAPAADAKGLRIDADLPSNLPSVTGDTQRLQQVFWNLLSNAVKFTDAGGMVSVSVRQQPRSLQVEVSDTDSGSSSLWPAN